MLPSWCISPPAPCTYIIFSSFHPSSAFPSPCPQSQISNQGHASFVVQTENMSSGIYKIPLTIASAKLSSAGARDTGAAVWGSLTLVRGTADVHLCCFHCFCPTVLLDKRFLCNVAVYETKLDIWNSFPVVGTQRWTTPTMGAQGLQVSWEIKAKLMTKWAPQ